MRGLTLALALAFSMVPAAKVLAKVDLTGTWTLDVARSEFGKGIGITAPTARTDSIRHAGLRLRDVMVQTKSGATRTTAFDYVLDGVDRVMAVGGQEIHYTASWFGDTLGID